MVTNDDFYIALQIKINTSFFNDFEDNRDIRRFGSDPYRKSGVRKFIKENILNKRFLNRGELNQYKDNYKSMIPYLPSLSNLYVSLKDEASRKLLIDLLAYRLLGYRKVKLPTNTPERNETITQLYNEYQKAEQIDTGYKDWKLRKYDMSQYGFDMSLLFSPEGIYVDFILQQYRYKTTELEIGVQPGDTVIDAGGCWGDTALYFASRGARAVYCYEFLPDNLKLLNKNLALNPDLSKNIHVMEKPVWSESGKDVFFTADGPGSRVSFESLGGECQSGQTHTIDDLVIEEGLDQVDFIKMDIEGAESPALKGAANTIKKFSPDLAISIYHSLDDFAHLHEYIQKINPDYQLYLAHHTIHLEETILFATTRA